MLALGKASSPPISPPIPPTLHWACLHIGCLRLKRCLTAAAPVRACVRKQCFLFRRSPSPLLPPFSPPPLPPPSISLRTLPALVLPPLSDLNYIALWVGSLGAAETERERERGRERQTGDGSELLSCAGEEDHLFFNEEGRERGGGRKKEAHRRRGSRGENSHRQTQLSSTFT